MVKNGEVIISLDETVGVIKILLTADNVRSFNDFYALERVKLSEETIEAKGKTLIYSAALTSEYIAHGIEINSRGLHAAICEMCWDGLKNESGFNCS
jgi:hypothetical protein